MISRRPRFVTLTLIWISDSLYDIKGIKSVSLLNQEGKETMINVTFTDMEILNDSVLIFWNSIWFSQFSHNAVVLRNMESHNLCMQNCRTEYSRGLLRHWLSPPISLLHVKLIILHLRLFCIRSLYSHSPRAERLRTAQTQSRLSLFAFLSPSSTAAILA